MKKIFALILCVLMAASVVACTPKEDTKATQKPTQKATEKASEKETQKPTGYIKYDSDTDSYRDDALAEAKAILKKTPYSYLGLVSALEAEGYSTADAEYAADHCGADWYDQALRMAQDAIANADTVLSYYSLEGHLLNRGFTEDQAAYGASQALGYSGNNNGDALQDAKDYVAQYPISYSGVIHSLENDGYTHDEAVYAADNCGADWEAEAIEDAQELTKYQTYTREELMAQLTYEGFTNDQAAIACNTIGL